MHLTQPLDAIICCTSILCNHRLWSLQDRLNNLSHVISRQAAVVQPEMVYIFQTLTQTRDTD